jgi:hypothetical protein
VEKREKKTLLPAVIKPRFPRLSSRYPINVLGYKAQNHNIRLHSIFSNLPSVLRIFFVQFQPHNILLISRRTTPVSTITCFGHYFWPSSGNTYTVTLKSLCHSPSIGQCLQFGKFLYKHAPWTQHHPHTKSEHEKYAFVIKVQDPTWEYTCRMRTLFSRAHQEKQSLHRTQNYKPKWNKYNALRYYGTVYVPLIQWEFVPTLNMCMKLFVVYLTALSSAQII